MRGQARGAQDDPCRHRRAASDAGGHPWGETGREHHQQRRRHERQGGAEAGPAEHRLEVGEEDHEDSRLHAEDHQQGHGAAGQTSLAEEADVEERSWLTQFPRDETDDAEDTDEQAQERHRRGPPSFRSFVEDKDESDHGDHGRERTEGVETVP
jgi:hypothetical protein